jgi:hypothetical protein
VRICSFSATCIPCSSLCITMGMMPNKSTPHVLQGSVGISDFKIKELVISWSWRSFSLARLLMATMVSVLSNGLIIHL